MDVGFVGLGAMGRAMATNLINAGHRVRVWNRSRAPVDALIAKGATAAATPQDAFAAEAVVSMLADDAAAKSVILDSGALNGAPGGLVHVNMATISVSCAQALADAHRGRGIAYVAAPASVGPMPPRPPRCTSSPQGPRRRSIASSHYSMCSDRKRGASATTHHARM